MGDTYCCWCPSINFAWLNFIWDFKLLEFDVGGYDKEENFLKIILKLTIVTTLNRSLNNMF